MSQVYKGSVLYVNGVPVAHAGPGGHACAQEECWVTVGGQKVKKTFMNMAYAQDLQGTTSRIFVNGYPIATLASQTSQSVGDADSEGGVKSGTVQGPAQFLTASHNVFFEGNPVIRHGDKVISNNENTEITTWNQPTSGSHHHAKIMSDPIEDLPEPSTLNIQWVRNPTYEFKPAGVQQSFCVTHQETGHRTYNNFGVFKSLDNKYLWHGDYLREGTYTVEEIYTYSNNVMRVPLGKIKTVPKEDNTPGLVLVPLAFRRYDDMQRSIKGSKILYPDTYIYLFKDGYLWRAFYTNLHDRLQEIDFALPDKSIRQSSNAELRQGILLPIEDAEGQHVFHVATSRLSLSWQMIHQLGGFDPTDSRFPAQYRLPIIPDPNLIELRLQPIHVDKLIKQGETISSMAGCQTEDVLLKQSHVCEPPQSNREWVLERDRWAHSTALEQAENDIYWHTPEPPQHLHTPTLVNLAAQALEPHILTGTAIVLLDDPLGRLIYTAELMIDQHNEYEAYVEQNGHAYDLGKLVSQMIEAVKNSEINEDYSKHIHEASLKKHMHEFDLKRDAYEAFMREGVELLKYWKKASIERGQWEDYYRFYHSLNDVNTISELFEKLEQKITSAFLFHQEGLAHLTEEAKTPGNFFEEKIDFVKKLSSYSPRSSLVYQTSTLMATVFEPSSVSFRKIADFFQTALKMEIEAEYVSVPLDELADFHQGTLIHESGPASSYIRVQTGIIETHRTLPPRIPNSKRARIVMVEKIPSYEWYKRVPNSNAPIHEQRLAEWGKFSAKIDKNPHLRAFLSVMAIFSAMSIKAQIKEMKEMGDLNSGSAVVLGAEIMRSGVLAVQFGLEAKILTRGMVRGEVSEAAKRAADKLNATGLVVGLFIDGYYTLVYAYHEEFGLTLAHGVSLSSNALGLLSLRYASTAASLSRTFGIAGLILGVIAIILICKLTKSTIEKWLYNGYWGKTKEDKKDIIVHSIEKFHFIISMASLIHIEPLDKDGKGVIPFHPGTVFIHAWESPPDLYRTKALAFKINLPSIDELLVKVSVFINAQAGIKQLYDHELVHAHAAKLDSGTGWTIIANLDHSSLASLLGWIKLECYDPHSRALLGKDAYQFTHNAELNKYLFEKVAYEFHG